MRHLLKLWWNDYKETWKFAKNRPFVIASLMVAIFLTLKLIGL